MTHKIDMAAHSLLGILCLLALNLVSSTYASVLPENGQYVEPASYEWASLPPIPASRQEQSVATFDDKVYIMGGITSNISFTPETNPALLSTLRTVSDTQAYDCKTQTWSYAAPMPMSVNHGNAATVDGKIYILGGLSGQNLSVWGAIPNSYSYDPTTDTWIGLPPMPVGTSRGGCAVGVHGSTIYLAGGLTMLDLGPDAIQDSVALVSSFDTKTGVWDTSLPPIPGPRDHVGGGIVGNTFYVTGGRDHGQFNTRNNTWALDIFNPIAWANKSPMPHGRGGLASAVVGDRYIFTFGGEGNPSTANSVWNNTEIYDTVTDNWMIGPAMSVPRHGTNAVAIGEDIYVPGGGVLLSAGPVNDMTVFKPKKHWGDWI